MSADPLDNDLEPTIIDSGLKAESVPMTPPPAGADNYEVGEEIARGGMASVLEAGDTKLKRTVAIKVMHLEAEESHSARQRFLREAQVLAMLAHPNIVPIYDIVWENGVPLFYSMKMVKGRTLQAILNGLRREEPDVLRDYTLDRLLLIFRKVCDAMAFAHSQGIIHRDLKPENVMVGEFGEVLVMDWGLAKTIRLSDTQTIRQGGNEAERFLLSDGLNVSLSQQTLQGSVMGTPKYMSPEQAQGRIDELDERSDLFSLGGILYTILTLRPPVEGTTLEEVLERVKTADIAEPSHVTTFQGSVGDGEASGDVLEAKRIKPLPHTPTGRVPPALSSVVMKALRREKAERYASVVDLSADIEKFQGGFATGAERAGAWTELRLLMLRHRAVTTALAAMLVLSVGFMIKVMASERRATESAEDSRRSLARAQIALAEAAMRSMDSVGLAQALDAVPEDLRDDEWNYLSRQRDRSEVIGLGELGVPLNILAMREEPGEFLWVDEGSAIHVLNAMDNRVVRSIETEIEGRKNCSLSGNHQVLAVAGVGGDQVAFFDAQTGGYLRAISMAERSFRMALNRDGSLLVVNSKTQRADSREVRALQLMDTESGRIHWSCDYQADFIDFHPDGDRLIVSSGNLRSLNIFSVEDGTEMGAIHDQLILSQAVSPDGRVVAAGTGGGRVLLIDAKSGELLETRQLHPAAVEAVAWTKSGLLLTMGDQGRIREGRWLLQIWRVPDFEPVDSLFGLETASQPPVLALCPETGQLITSGRETRVWKLPVDQECHLVTHTSEQGWSNAFMDDVTLIARESFGLAVYDLSHPRQAVKEASPLPSQRFNRCAVHWPSGRLAVATGTGGSNELKVFHRRDGALVEEQAWPLASLASTVRFDAAGERIAMTVPFGGGRSRVVDLAAGKTLLTLPRETAAMVFAGSGNNVVAAMPHTVTAGAVEFDLVSVDGQSGETLRSVRVPWRMGALDVTPDRKMIAVGGSDKRVHFFDAVTLEETGSFRAHDADITALRFHPTLPMIATGSLDRSVKVWHLEVPIRQGHLFRGLEGTPVALAFNPAGSLLAVDGLGLSFYVFEVQASAEAGGTDEPSTQLSSNLDADEDGSLPPETAATLPASFVEEIEGWEDVLAQLTPEEVETNGPSWMLEDGELFSPEPLVTLPLPCELAGGSYQMRLTLRRMKSGSTFHIALPVGDRMCGFGLDGRNGRDPPTTGLVTVNGKWGKALPGVVKGRQVNDFKPHDLDIAVQLKGASVTITTLLDSKLLYEWSGPIAALRQANFWIERTKPDVLAFGNGGPWVISRVKVKRLDEGDGA